MKPIRSVFYFLSAIFFTTVIFAKPSSVKKPAIIKSAIAKHSPAVAVGDVPYLKNIQGLPLPVSNGKQLASAWEALYNIFKLKNESTAGAAQTKEELAAIAPLFEMNCLLAMQNYLDPKNFPKLPNYPTSQLDINYATHHLLAALQRLNSVFSMSLSGATPKSSFAGDNRDLGVIVNIKNNTKAQFSVSQASLSGSQSVQIGQINPGVNAVNLHTAALQSKQGKEGSASAAPSTSTFNLKEMNSEAPTEITICMMSGTEFVEFLRTLPRSKEAIKKDTFEMNGLQTSPEYLVEAADWYLVLIQNPTDASAAKRNPGQRIQLINVSKLAGPYLLSMQINAEDVAIIVDGKKTGKEEYVFQPSFTEVQIMQSQGAAALPIPLLILPQFLWQLPTMQTIWMVMSSALLAEATGCKFFGKDSFGDAFEYFQGLGCFGNQSRYAFFVDRYNVASVGITPYDATWLLSAAIYETNLQNCSDINQIYSAQDTYGHVIVNIKIALYINFLALFVPSIPALSMKQVFMDQGFNFAMADPFNSMYSFVVSTLDSDIKEGIFGAITQLDDGVYRLTWTNKKNKVINSQVLYLGSKPASVQISFLNQMADWVGSAVPTPLIQLSPGETTHFKVTYEYSPANSKHILLAQETSPIDRQEFIVTRFFSKYPIKELYLDVYHRFNVKPHTRCFVIKDGVLPEPLTSLTESDWKNGVFFIPVVHNNEDISFNRPGALTMVFYKSDKTLLGEVAISGQFNNTSDLGIKEPVVAYNLCSSDFNSMKYLYLKTGVFLKYDHVS